MTNYSELELHKQDEHFETIASKIGAFFTYLTPVELKTLPLTFSITTKR